MKGALDEVVRAMEETACIPEKRTEESMLLLKTWRKLSLNPLPSPRFPTHAS